MMLTFNTIELPEMRLNCPQEGNWTAHCQLPLEELPEGSVVIALGSISLQGTVTRAASLGGQVSVTVVGGAGGLTALASAHHYSQVSPERVFSDLCAIGGEAPSPDVLGGSVDWCTREKTVAEQLKRLAGFLGCSWWVEDSGEVRFGTRETAVPSTERTLFDDNGTLGERSYVVEDIDLRPGMVLDGKTIRKVAYEIKKGRARATLEIL